METRSTELQMCRIWMNQNVKIWRRSHGKLRNIRGIKQFCGVEKCQARKEESQRAHIMFSLRAFLRLELQRIKTGISWFESTMKIRREAVTAYLNNPLYTLN